MQMAGKLAVPIPYNWRRIKIPSRRKVTGAGWKF